MADKASKKAAELLAHITGACPNDTSRTDCVHIDGWEPNGGCESSCTASVNQASKCWLEWAAG